MINFYNHFNTIDILPTLRFFTKPRLGFGFGWLSFYCSVVFLDEEKDENFKLVSKDLYDQKCKELESESVDLLRLRKMEKAIKKHPELRRAVQAALDRDDIKLMLMFHPPVVSPFQPEENKGHSETTDSHAGHQQEQG